MRRGDVRKVVVAASSVEPVLWGHSISQIGISRKGCGTTEEHLAQVRTA